MQILIEQLGSDTYVIGVDEHTGVIFDLDTHEVDIVGKGNVTVLAHGKASHFFSKTQVTLDQLLA